MRFSDCMTISQSIWIPHHEILEMPVIATHIATKLNITVVPNINTRLARMIFVYPHSNSLIKLQSSITRPPGRFCSRGPHHSTSLDLTFDFLPQWARMNQQMWRWPSLVFPTLTPSMDSRFCAKSVVFTGFRAYINII
jgi:hypothetical protein